MGTGVGTQLGFGAVGAAAGGGIGYLTDITVEKCHNILAQCA